MDARVDALQAKLREIFEVKSGYKDEKVQAKLLEKHFKYFDTDGSGVIDFDEFSRSMVKLNFVGVQAEIEAVFDRFDEDLNGTISYGEFANAVFGTGGKALISEKSKSIIDRVKQKILDSGGKNGIRTLGVILRRMDKNGNGVVEIEELYEGLLQLGIPSIEEHELQRIFRHFDRDNSGKVTVEELLRGLRGTMPKRRIKLIKEAFSSMDLSGDGTVTIDEVERLYDPSQHPEVLAGRMNPRHALLEFMKVFEEGKGDGTITWHEFLTYYKDLSSGIDSDDEFELMIRNAWHISGGKGWCENTSCRRVLVTHSDGTQEVVEIENDIGISIKDKRKMIQKLQQQGVRDIAEITLSS